jgi:hypothetical protein
MILEKWKNLDIQEESVEDSSDESDSSVDSKTMKPYEYDLGIDD